MTNIGAASDADYYIDRWLLTPEGNAIVTRTSHLLPVRWQGVAAVLKIAVDAEEELGNELMTWWNGQGVPLVLAQEGKAILLERAQEVGSLADLVRRGRDDDATRIICAVVGKLHLPKSRPIPNLNPLSEWFGELASAANTHGGILSLSAETAHALFVAPREISVLHGDIHHDNILHFGERGWLAIDPKGLIGEYAFDYANLFCNPNHKTAADPRRFGRRLEIVTKTAHLDRNRMLRWILAWGGLSAAWKINDNIPPDTPLRVAELAAAELRLEVEYSTRIEGPFNMQGPVGSVLHPVPVFDGRRGAICREALESLPEWFGIPASVESYVAAADELPMLACFDPAGDVVGFVSVKPHTAFAAEVYVMGVKRSWQRRGIGRALIEAVVELAISQGVRFLTVKTLSPSNDDPNYARTRLFYEAVGFLPIEEFPTLWGPENPCIFMLRPISSG